MIIPGFSAYNIEANGRVTVVATGETVKPHIVKCRNSQYTRVSIRGDDGYIGVYNVMALLALTYMNKPLHDGIVRAKDGNNLNATLDNVLCTNQSSVTKQAWKDGKMCGRRKKERSYCNASMTMIYESMMAYDGPVTMATLSCDLQVPYSTVRYSMLALLDIGKVRKTKDGFEVIR